MGAITRDMRSIVDSTKLAFAATVCEDGSPNLSPKGSMLVHDDDHLVFMHMASPTTVANVRLARRDGAARRRAPAGCAVEGRQVRGRTRGHANRA